jgi:hypothetical protein
MPLVCVQLPITPYGPPQQYCIQIPAGGGGGSAGTFQPQSTILPSSIGGVFAKSQVCLYPCLNTVTNQMEYRTFDVSQPANDPVNASSYLWRVEQMKPYRNPTVRKLLWTFTDLGQVTVTWTLTGVTEQQKVIQQSTSLGVGNKVPTLAMMTVEVDINITGMNLQLSVSRNAGDGPLSVVKVVIVGEIEEFSP